MKSLADCSPSRPIVLT